MASISRWDPFAELSRLQDEMTRFGAGNRRGAGFSPAVDIYEEKEAILVRVELPGVKPEDVQITVENNLLTIGGERKLEREESQAGYHRVEGSYGAFTRSFALPNTVNTEKIEASMENGILVLRVSKRAEAQPRRIPVSAGSSQSARSFSAAQAPGAEQKQMSAEARSPRS